MKQPMPVVRESDNVDWNSMISSVVSGAVLHAAGYIELDRRPIFIQAIETVHTNFSRHQLAHSSSFMTLMEIICPQDRQSRQYSVDEWLEFTVCFHALLSPEDIDYLNTRIVTALSVYFMEHPDDLLTSIHGDFQVGRKEFEEWVTKVAWYRAACAVILFWLPADYRAVSAELRSAYVEQRGG